MNEWIKKLPKTELHVHIEGTLTPEQIFFFADRNKVKLPYKSINELKAAYRFTDLASFLSLYFQGSSVVYTERDFYDMTWAYLLKVREQGVRHVEIFFDTQSYLARGIPTSRVVSGLYAALQDGYKQLGISGLIILCFLRQYSEQEAMAAFESALSLGDKIIGFGLAAHEIGNPPIKFAQLFERIRSYGYHTVAHAGEEAGPEYIWQALEVLHVDRIDHGIKAIYDTRLMEELVARQVPITVCPLSNFVLRLYDQYADYPLKKMLDAGCAVSLHSDDPAYFGGYIADNYVFAFEKLGLTRADIITCARNSITGSFLDNDRKALLIAELENYILTTGA